MNIKILTLDTLTKILKSLPYAVLISIIMSIGTNIQVIFTSLFISEYANMYDTLYKGLIVVSHANFIEWLTAYFQPLFVPPSLLIIILSIKGENSKNTLVKIMFFVFLTLMITDYFYHNFGGKNYNFLLSLISNLFGAPIISGIVILSLDMVYTLNHYFETDKAIWRNIIGSIFIILFGLLLAFATYLMDKSIYTLTASKIDLTVKFPIYGTYNVDTGNKKNINGQYGLFSSETSNTQYFLWTGFNKNFSLAWNNKTNQQSHVYNAEIRVLDACINDKNIIRKALLSPPTYVIKNIHSIKLNIDDGLSFMYILQNPLNNGKISILGKGNIHIAIEKSKHKGYTLQRYINPSSIIKHSSWMNETSYALVLPNMDIPNSKAVLINRNIEIQTEEKKLKFNLKPNTNLLDQPKIYCKTMHRVKNDEYIVKGIGGGVILTLKQLNIAKTTNEVLFELNNPEKTFIQGFSGFMVVDEINKNKLSDYINDGALNNINLNAPIQELFIDEKKYTHMSSSSDIYMADTNLTGQITTEGLRFSGSSNAIAINEWRVNQSRYEKLDPKYKYSLIAILFGGLSYIFRKIIQILKDNKQYTL